MAATDTPGTHTPAAAGDATDDLPTNVRDEEERKDDKDEDE